MYFKPNKPTTLVCILAEANLVSVTAARKT
jgi:hypothetical protein